MIRSPITTHYHRPATSKRCKIGYRYNKKTGLCNRTVWPTPNTRKIKRCKNGHRRNKATNKCVPKLYLNSVVVADYEEESE